MLPIYSALKNSKILFLHQNNFMKTLKITKIIIFLFAIVFSACQPKVTSEKKSVIEPSVFFKNIQTGATVDSAFLIQMGVEGMGVEIAGEKNDLMGHHHIIINSDFIIDGDIVPTDKKHIHFGAGQTEYQLDLAPGKYSLTLQFANGFHQSYGEKMSKTINVTVK